MATLDFLILGPFQVVDQQPLALGGPRQRAVLALLLLNRGEVVTTDRMIDELWGEHPPRTVGKAIHVYISNLRKVVGDGVVLTSDGGYRLDIEANQVDADRFDGLVARGRTALERGYPRLACERLREALALWRGRPLADFSYHQFAQSEIARLEELRMAALEDRIEAELALGAHAALVPELETHVRASPERERLWGQLMVALYRSGRQADALERYRRARRILIDEFAIEPGRDLKEIERAILTQDAKLDAPALDPIVDQGRQRPTPGPPPGVPSSSPSEPEPTGAADAEADREEPALGPTDSERRGTVTTALRGVAALAGPAAVASRLRDARSAIDARWHERRLEIVAGAALVLIAVIVVAVVTSVGGSKAGPGRRPSAGGRPTAGACSHCVASISSPRTGGVYIVGQSVLTSFSCTVKTRGQVPTSCDDSTGSHTKTGGHGRLNTATAGLHAYMVTVTVKGRPSTTASISYRVVARLATSIETGLATVLHRHTKITVSCLGGRPGAKCRGRLELTIRRLISGHVRLVPIARAPYAASPGSSTVVVLRLTRLGMQALRRAAGHQRGARVTATLPNAAAVRRTIKLRLG